MAIAPSTAALAHFLLIIIVGFLPVLAKWKHTHFDIFLSIGAGVLLSAAFLHMLPSAIHILGETAGLYVLLGFLAIFFLEHFTMAHACGEEACPNHQLGYATFFGLSVHSIISGLALGVGLKSNVGMPVAIAMLAAVLIHKVPETLALVVLLLRAHWSKQKVLLFNFLYACMGPAGILLGSKSVTWLGAHTNNSLGIAVAVSCGTFLYIASSDLLPHLHKKEEGKWWHLLAFLFGLLILAFDFGGAGG
jgi:zinc and cadmium transporter